MKLSEYAKRNNITYKTAHRHWQLGLLKGKQLVTGTIVINDDELKHPINKNKVVLYARVSSSENKKNLETQLSRLRNYASAKGYLVIKEVKEVGSGLNDNRKKIISLLEDDDWSIIIVEHKDRLARFGLNFVKILLKKLGKEIEVINEVDSDTKELMQDFISIITSFTARLYGLKRSKRKTEKIINELNEK